MKVEGGRQEGKYAYNVFVVVYLFYWKYLNIEEMYEAKDVPFTILSNILYVWKFSWLKVKGKICPLNIPKP